MTGLELTKWYIYLIWIFVLIILLTFSAIFSSAETAYTSVGVAKIETMVENKVRGAKLIKKQHQFFNRTLGTILIANNLVNILASVLFYCIYYMSVLMNPISTQALFGYRMIFTLPIVFGAIFLLKQQRNFKFMLLKIRVKPKILFILFITSLLSSFQMWLYLWAPSNGAALKVSIGYLILPIVMVIVGRLVFKEHLSKIKLLSISFAVLGVGSSLVSSSGISWESAGVFCLYPVYFGLRKFYGIANFPSFAIEMFFMFLFSSYFITLADMDFVLSKNPKIYYLLVLMGIISGTALISQIISSILVPINVLGLLTYLEPIFMFAVSFMIGEKLDESSYFLMFCLSAAIILLMIDSLNNIKISKRATRWIRLTSKQKASSTHYRRFWCGDFCRCFSAFLVKA
mgnify:CR=1 FL=1